MQQRSWVNAALALGLLISMALPGCVVVPDQDHYVGGVVMVAPGGSSNSESGGDDE